VSPYLAAPNQQGEVVEKTKRPEFVYFDLPENTPAQYVPSQEEKLKAVRFLPSLLHRSFDRSLSSLSTNAYFIERGTESQDRVSS